MDFALNDTSSLKLELQECGGLDSYLTLNIHHGLDDFVDPSNRCYYSAVFGKWTWKNETDCGKVTICKESDTSAGK